MEGYGKRYFLFLIVFLGALSAFGPFITDFYLPSMPSMAEVFRTSPTMVQLGLTASMVGLAIGQMLFGPLSDKWGRRPLLTASLVVFSVSALASIFSPTIEFFNVCRFLQGLGGAGGIVMSRSVATDCWRGRELARILAIVSTINGIAPVVAPVVGGFVGQFTGWQGIFCILLAIGVVLLGMSVLFRESLAEEERVKGSVKDVVVNFLHLFRLRYFRIYICIFALGYGVLFSYLSSTSFVIQDHFGFDEIHFSLIFALNATGSAIGSALALRFRRMKTAALFSMAGMTLSTALQLILVAATDTFLAYETFSFLELFFLGFMFPSVTSLTMEEGKGAIGGAAAILGCSGYLFGGLVSPLAGIGDILVSSGVVMLLCATGGLLLARVAWRRQEG